MGARKPWRFASNSSEVFLEVNPSEDNGSLSIIRVVKYPGHGTGFNKQILAFSGFCQTEEQYNTLLGFLDSSEPFVIDDDLGRSFDSCVVSSLSFERAPLVNYQWRHSYNFKAYYVPEMVLGL